MCREVCAGDQSDIIQREDKQTDSDREPGPQRGGTECDRRAQQPRKTKHAADRANFLWISTSYESMMVCASAKRTGSVLVEGEQPPWAASVVVVRRAIVVAISWAPLEGIVGGIALGSPVDTWGDCARSRLRYELVCPMTRSGRGVWWQARADVAVVPERVGVSESEEW